MYPNIAGTLVNDKAINEVDIQRDNFIFEISKTMMAFPSNDQKGATVTVVPNNSRTKFGLRQPHIKAPGKTVSVLQWSTYEPETLLVGTTEGILSLWKVPEKGLKGDLSKPTAQLDCKEEIKCAAFHPIAKNLVAVGLRNGHVQLFDEKLDKPLVDLVHGRPLNAVTWSNDGQLLFALYVDMVLKVWDVRANSVLVEKKVATTRGVGILQPLVGRRVLVSFSQSGKQELRILDEKLEEQATRQAGQFGTPLNVYPHFSGVIVANTSKEPRVTLLDGETLKDIATYVHSGPVLAANYQPLRPDPDGAVVLLTSLLNVANCISRVEWAVPAPPAQFFFPCPTGETDIDAATWIGGKNGELKAEKLVATIKAEEKKEETTQVAQAPQTYYKYLQADPDPPRNYYINLPVGNAPNPEFNEVATNGSVFAFIGAGNTPPIHIMPLNKPQRFTDGWKQSIVDPHGSGVSTLSFSPHKPSLVVSGGEDNKCKIWEIPDNFTEPIRDPTVTFSGHFRRVSIAKFSECVSNLVMTATGCPEVHFWDINTEKEVRSFSQIMGVEPLQDAELNEFSSLVYTIFRDGSFKAYDPRAQDPKVMETHAHSGGKAKRILNIPDFGYVATFGGNRRGERECAIWDVRKFDQPLKSVEFDTSSSAMLPMYEEGSGIIYVGGKGDGHIRFVELCHDDRVVAISGIHESSSPERGLCLLPRKHCDIMKCEVSRMLKLSTESMHVLHWRVLRSHPEYFQDMIYPPVRDTHAPLMQVVDWLDNHNEVYPMYDFQPAGTKKASEIVPLLKEKQASSRPKYSIKQEEEQKQFTVEEIVAMAPQISSEDEQESESSESW